MIKPNLTDFASFSAQMGEWIADKDLHYLDLTGQWERFGEWLESGLRFGHFCLTCRTFHCADARPGEHNFTEWPPRNIVLLGRASTQRELDSCCWSMITSGIGDWRRAVLLTPVEEIRIDPIVGFSDRDLDYPPAAEQIIVQPPAAATWGAYSWDLVEAIIRQVREIRGRCDFCLGDGIRMGTGIIPPPDCPCCHGSGLAPGLPRLLIEGDEWYQERIEL